ncbi:MAG: glycosyltransferase [Oscillospiraceae bacterium]|nr:glycosyltransferase [Oscillospiraceae bacterium]
MRILFIASEIPYPDDSGGKRYTWQKIRQLSKENEITLIAINEFNNSIDKNILKKYVKEFYFFPRVKNWMKIIFNFYKPYSMISRENIYIKSKIKEIIYDNKIDVICLDSIHMYYNISKLDLKNIPIFLTQHNIEYMLFQSISNKTNNMLKKIIYKFETNKLKQIEKKLYKNKFFKGYIFISDIDNKIYEEEIGQVNSICIPPCVEQGNEQFYKNINKDAIVFIGKMDYEPNVIAMEWFTKSIFPNILDKLPKSKLYIVGKDPTKEIKKLSSKNIIVTGAVKSVKEYLSKAQIVVIPLLNGGGIKLKLFEALETNNIVITTEIGIEGTCFKNNIDLLVSNDSEFFAQLCIENLINPNYGIAEHGNKTLRNNYGFEILERKLNKFIQG